MNIEKLKYSKCPYCKKYGINHLEKINYRYNPIVTCKYCLKKFRANFLLTTFGKIIIILGVGFLGQKLKTIEFFSGIPFWVYIVLAFILYFIFHYFVPVEELDDDDKY